MFLVFTYHPSIFVLLTAACFAPSLCIVRANLQEVQNLLSGTAVRNM